MRVDIIVHADLEFKSIAIGCQIKLKFCTLQNSALILFNHRQLKFNSNFEILKRYCNDKIYCGQLMNTIYFVETIHKRR